MAVFASVVQHGSMSGAGRALGMSASAVSQQVRQLERDGGVTLLHRSTRKLGLTEAGERFHNRCAAMVLAAEQARAEMNASRDAPSGVLRLSAPVGFARHVAPALGTLLADNPALRAATDRGEPVVAVFVLDEVSPGIRPLGGAARWWLHHSLAELGEQAVTVGQTGVTAQTVASVAGSEEEDIFGDEDGI